MAWYKLLVEVGLIGCDREEDFEVPDDLLADAPNDRERELVIADFAKDVVANLISWSWTPIEEPRS